MCRCLASRYDTVVFRIDDGRWLLVSAGAHPPTLQSHDLFHWEVCNDTALQFPTDEGPHVTRWKGSLWMNWEPRCDDTASTRNGCEKNIMRSSDGGAHWTEQPLSLFANDSHSTRYLDSGQTHQGPLLPQGESALVLYFAPLFSNARASRNVNGCALLCLASLSGLPRNRTRQPFAALHFACPLCRAKRQ